MRISETELVEAIVATFDNEATYAQQQIVAHTLPSTKLLIIEAYSVGFRHGRIAAGCEEEEVVEA